MPFKHSKSSTNRKQPAILKENSIHIEQKSKSGNNTAAGRDIINSTNGPIDNSSQNVVRTTTNEKELIEPEKKYIIDFIKKTMTDSSLSCIRVNISVGSNGAKFAQQLKLAINDIGYTNISEGQSYPSSEGVTFSIIGKCLEITIGTF